MWIKQYGELDLALHMWTRLVEQQDLEIEMLLQMQGLLVFGVMVSTLHYAQFYIDLNEALHREHEPETADVAAQLLPRTHAAARSAGDRPRGAASRLALCPYA